VVDESDGSNFPLVLVAPVFTFAAYALWTFLRSLLQKITRLEIASFHPPPEVIPEVILRKFVGGGSVGNVFLGCAGANLEVAVVGKVAVVKTSRVLLHREAHIYSILSELQGSSIPVVYGLFVGSGLGVLFMQYGGKAIRAFADLSLHQRYCFMLPKGIYADHFHLCFKDLVFGHR
jgi:hypothetical protein